MAAHENLNEGQFEIQHPYPRLRESYARNWADSIASMYQSEGDLVQPMSLLPDGREQAKLMLDEHLASAGSSDVPKQILIDQGFKDRKRSRRNYGSWTN
jgi:hypothetical protein